MMLTELGVTFDSDLLEDFIVFNQQGYDPKTIEEMMNLPKDVFQALEQFESRYDDRSDPGPKLIPNAGSDPGSLDQSEASSQLQPRPDPGPLAGTEP